MNIIVGDLCVSLVLFIYPKVISTTNWCIFNCQIMLRILLASLCLYVVCWCITQRRTSIYIDRYLNESYVWHVFYVSKHLCEFYYVIHVLNSLDSYVSSEPILMGLTSLTEMSKSNFTSVFWIMILLCWKRSLLLLLMLVAMKRKSIIKLGKDLTDSA